MLGGTEKLSRLKDKICSIQNFKLAVQTIKNNKGSKTSGNDGLIIQDVIDNLDKFAEEILSELRDGQYTPQPVKRVFIKQTEKNRPLGIPTIKDRVIQQMFKQVLEPILEPKFHDNSFGFRPNRSVEHAISRQNIFINVSKLYHCVDIDIKGFFNNINHKKLIKQLYSLGIKDKFVLSVIKVMLKADVVLPDGSIENTNKGTPQGGILSPLLSNVVLNELDWWIHKQWAGIRTRKKYARQDGKEVSLRKTKLTEVKMVRYADDFKLFCRNKNDAEKMMKITRNFLNHRLELEISESKSRIVNLKKGSSEFLGFRVKAKPKGNKFYSKVNLSDKSIKSIQSKLIQQIQRIKKSNNKLKEVFKYNSMVRGIQNYYKIATHCSTDFQKIGYIINRKLYNSLGEPRGQPDARFRRLYKGYNPRVWNVNEITIFPIQCVKSKVAKQFSTKNKLRKNTYIENSEIMYNSIGESSLENSEWLKLRATVYYKQKGICPVTMKYMKHDEFHLHHIIPKAYGGKDTEDNVIAITKDVHISLHSKEPDKNYMENTIYAKLYTTIQSYKNNN